MWWNIGWAVLLLVALIIVPLVFLYLRRRWLTGQGGAFDCAMRRVGEDPTFRWHLGMGRYRGEELQWFRAFSLSMRPALRLRRGQIHSSAAREPSRADSFLLYDNSCVLTVRDATRGRSYYFGVERDVATALMSWMEAAPPGLYPPSGPATPE